ncbi:MAG TPA: hypothetical protein VEJ84_23620, partial [Acidimicrobiales bacterium]|nr:hypothetical protein [Acidimicrobiales bacterium]
YVLDSKGVGKGRISVRRVGVILARGPAQLFVGSRNRTSYVEGMRRQVEAVAKALSAFPEASEVDIRAMVVISGAEWGLLARPYNVQRVWVGWPKAAAKLVASPGPLNAEARSRLAHVIAARLPVA